MTTEKDNIGEISIHKRDDVFEVYQWTAFRDAGVFIGDYASLADAKQAAAELSASTGLPVVNEAAS